MKLLALELRKHRTLIGGLLAVSLLWTAWMVRQVYSGQALFTLAANIGFLAALIPAGLLVPIALARGLNREATGPLAFLLVSPRSGAFQVFSRFVVATATLAVYYAILTGVSCWVASSLGIVYDAWAPWAAWAYLMIAYAAPAVLLGIVYGLVTAAYRPGRAGQVVAVTSFFGVVSLWSWLNKLGVQHLGFLPQIPVPGVSVPRSVAPVLGLTPQDVDLRALIQSVLPSIPTAPLLVGLLLAAALFALAARLWEEVEWA
ncbi:hypothetical protein [Oceanithermus sp.]